MKMNSILKRFLIKYFPAIIFFILKNYFGLDLNDFNPFTSETKVFFNEEGEGFHRENNDENNNDNINTPNENSPYYWGDHTERIFHELLDNEQERRRLVEEIRSLSKNISQEYDMLIDNLDLDERKKRLIN